MVGPAAFPLLAAEVATQLDGYLDQADFTAAAALLVEQVSIPLHHPLHSQLAALLRRFPPAQRETNPDLLCLHSQLQAPTDAATATTTLLRATLLYKAQRSFTRAALCYFELIRLYSQREEFRTAFLYVGEVEALLQQLSDPTLEAQFLLRLAELCPDLGRLRESIGYAQRAAGAFRALSDLRSQFTAHILLAVLHRQLGDYHAAEAHLELGRQLHQAGQLGDEAYGRVLNAAAHLAWYQGNLPTAIHQAEQYVRYAERTAAPKARVYSALLLGNLYRARGAFTTAQQWYNQTRGFIDDAAAPLFRPWVDVQEGWLYALSGDYLTARRLIHQALTTPDRGQLMSFNVYLALLNLLTAEYVTAETLLRTAQNFYEQSGDELATAVLHLYRAYTLERSGQAERAAVHLEAGFAWLAARHITSFPIWWHGGLVAEICALALRAALHVDLVEHMLAHHVGGVARPALLALLATDDPLLEQRVRPILALLDAQDERWLAWLATIDEAPVRQVLEELFRQAGLRHEQLAELQATLTTAQQHDKANPVLMAVFGRYVQGATIKEIATQLQRAPSSIRNYVTSIYQIFGLAPSDYPSLQARRAQLSHLARQRGFVG